MTTLTCPRCKGTRIAQDMQAVIAYLVEYDGAGVDIVEPAHVVHGHVDYDLIGTWGADTDVFCADPACGYEGHVDEFLPDEDDEPTCSRCDAECGGHA